MAEPSARAERIDTLFPWLRHWSIGDERIGGFRSDAYALDTPDGLVLIDRQLADIGDRFRLSELGSVDRHVQVLDSILTAYDNRDFDRGDRRRQTVL